MGVPRLSSNMALRADMILAGVPLIYCQVTTHPTPQQLKTTTILFSLDSVGQQFELVSNSEQFCWCHLGSRVLCTCYSFYTLADQRKPCHIVPNLDNLLHVLWTVPVVETSSYFPSERDVSFPSTPLMCKRVLKAATCCISLLGLPSKMLQTVEP